MTDRGLPKLTERGGEVVDLLKRFGIVDAAACCCFFPGLSADASRKFLDRMVEDRWLRKHHLATGQAYYVLSDSACHNLGMKRNGSALRQGPLIKRCLVLFYLASRTALRLLTATECRQSLPSLYRRGGANMYFIDSQDNSLGWICLDEGKNPQRVHSNVFEQAAKRRTIADIRSLTAAGRFRILVLTTSDAKAALLRELFSKRPLRDVKVEIAAVPGCIELALHCP